MASSQPTIAKLPPELCNQIAAGEVVERPASAVKELIENALDAGARTVHVAIDSGGVARIEVSDDGSGMSREDLRLAVERHATSKIASMRDLETIGTFGFRGEALPSIGSVSRMTIRTRRSEDLEGSELSVSGGNVPAPLPSGGAAGTTVTVRDLFYNVPARRKFLKATATEAAHVGEVVADAALARHDVAFTLSRDGRLQREYLRAPTRAERARAVLREENLTRCASDAGSVRIEAYLAPPERARTGALGLHLLVNGRAVRDRQLARAVAHAFGSVLEPGRYPLGVVYVELPLDHVDVNVHPQKSEVRFVDARRLCAIVSREIGHQLAQAVPGAGAPTTFLPKHDAKRRPDGPAPSFNTVPGDAVEFLPLRDRDDTAERAQSPLFGDGTSLWKNLRFIAQVRAMYLLCEHESGLFVIDQHAAAERVAFHRLRTSGGDVAQQHLLAPEVVTVREEEASLLEQHADAISRIGVTLRRVGPDAVAVDAVPAMLRHGAPRRIVTDLADEILRAGERAFGARIDHVFATMACHGSVRAGDTLAPEEARALLDSLDTVEFSGHCPHGRPVVTSLTWSELERRVGR